MTNKESMAAAHAAYAAAIHDAYSARRDMVDAARAACEAAKEAADVVFRATITKIEGEDV